MQNIYDWRSGHILSSPELASCPPCPHLQSAEVPCGMLNLPANLLRWTLSKALLCVTKTRCPHCNRLL